MINPEKYYSVSDVNKYIKAVLTTDQNLKFLPIKGEISNLKKASNGHFYFSLKDKESVISVVMFSTYGNKLNFLPKDGDEVFLIGSIDCYTPRGSYQILAFEMEQLGKGDILYELEILKKRLQEEGLFDKSRKKEIDLYPSAIGLITAKGSAALKDLVFNIKRRYPIADIYVFYSSVQGEGAAEELTKTLIKAQEYPLTTIIIGRGGGASEDLSAFNDETLVRAIADCEIPIIAAVGHEIDFTLVDFVADKRASTPTGAAELVCIDSREVTQNLFYATEIMKDSINKSLINMRDNIMSCKDDLIDSIKQYLFALNKNIEVKKEKLIGLNPKSILQRGFTITLGEDRKPIKDIHYLKNKDKIYTVTNDGEIVSEVLEVK